MRSRPWLSPLTLTLTAAVLALTAALALAALPQQGGTVDLRANVDGKVRSNSVGESLSGAVAGVGDFNGDGLGDMALTVLEGGATTARVVFGVNAPFDAQLNDDKQIAGAGGGVVLTSSRPVTAIARAGDVNADGRADLVLGSCTRAASDAGRAWVVFGRSGNAAINLDALGTGGFVINGAANSCLGSAVDAAGNANGDAHPDVVLGTVESGAGKGGAVVVFGKPGAEPVDAAALGTGGYSMSAPAVGDGAGQYVAGLGDVNGDGRGDVGVGAPTHDPAIGGDAGAVWVVFGRVIAAPTNIALAQIGPNDDRQGFRIDGPEPGALLGPVASAGDVNGDAKADVAVGAPADDRGAGGGSVSVVFGKDTATDVQTASLNDFGYQYRDPVANDGFGSGLRGGADVNGDGLPDILAGAPTSDPNTLRDAGTVFALFGRPSVSGGATDDALAPADPANGFKITGPRGSVDGSQSPSLVGSTSSIGLGDLNGDARPDIISGVSAGPVSGGTTDPGTAFVTLGFGQPAFRVPSSYVFTAGAPAAPVVPTDVRRTGTATFSITPALPAGLALDPATGTISGTPKEEMARRQFTIRMTDIAGDTQRLPFITITPGPDTTPPVISKARVNNRRFRVGARPTALKAARKRVPFGTQLRMNVSEAVTLKIAIACAKPIRGKRRSFCRKKINTRRATFTRRLGRGGDTVFSFTGRIGRKTKLLPGKYTFTVVATDLVKLVSKPAKVRFEVVK